MKKTMCIVIMTLFCILGVSSSASATVDLTSDLGLYFPFDGSIEDASGNMNIPTVIGSISYADDQNGAQNSALKASTSYTSYIEVATDPSFQIGTGVATYSVWFRTASVSKYLAANIYIDRSGGGDGTHIYCANYIFKAYFEGGGEGASAQYSTSNFTAEQWVHFVVTLERSSTTGVKIYADKILVATGDTTDLANESIIPTIVPYLAKSYRGDSYNNFRMYKRILNADEIEALYDETNPDPINYIDAVGIADTDNDGVSELASLTKTSAGTIVRIADVDGNTVTNDEITGFFNSSTEWIPLSIAITEVNGHQGISVTGKNDVIDEVQIWAYDLEDEIMMSSAYITMPLYVTP